MLKIVGNLNSNELLILKNILSLAVIVYQYYDIDDDLIGISPENTLLVYNETKTKSTFIKTLETKLGKDIVSAIKYRIDKPSAFNTNQELFNNNWAVLLKYKADNGDISIADCESSMVMDSNNIYYIEDVSHNKLEVRPDGAVKKLNNSLTHSEFNVLKQLREVFNFNRFNIVK